MINAKLYTTANNTPMSVFIRCLIYGDLKALKKSKGFIKTSKLKSVWSALFNEYLEQSGDTSRVFLLNALKEWAILTNNIKLIDDHLQILANGYNENLASNLKRLGFTIKPIKERDKYIKQIKSINTQAKKLVLQANKIKKDLDQFESEKKTETVTEKDFLELFAILSKNQGYYLDPKAVTVAEFVVLIKLHQDKNNK